MSVIKSPSQVMREIATRVKALRLRRHWSREELATYSEVNIYSLKRFERTGKISLERLLRLCAALEVLEDFNHILKPRERIDVNQWSVSQRKIRQRGRRRSRQIAETVDEGLLT